MGLPDIHAISGDYVQGSFTLLPLSGERAGAVLFFARLMEVHARESATSTAIRYFRAALGEFKSIFDLLPSDLKDLGLSQQWSRSPLKTELDALPLISVLKKVRNFAVHSARVRGYGREFRVTVLGDGGDAIQDIPSIFVESLERNLLGRDIGDISDDSLDWFNRQASFWPAHLLLQEAIYETSVPLRNFLTVERKDAAQPIVPEGAVR